MTTNKTTANPTGNAAGKTPPATGTFRLPDIPEKHPDDMTSAKQLAETGKMDRLRVHLGHSETTIVSAERYVCAQRGAPMRYPDLLVAFDADPELYEDNNGYVASHQGKPPDLVLEIASSHTGHIDTGVKVEFYAGLRVGEYWRFDETGEHHGAKLAGERLVEGRYEPIEIETLPNGELRGYSEALGLWFCWRGGRLDWYDPQAEDYLPSLESLRARAEIAEARADTQQARADTQQARADAERQAREAAEARVRELEARLEAAGG